MASKWIASLAALTAAAGVSLAQSPRPASPWAPVVNTAAHTAPEEVLDPQVDAAPAPRVAPTSSYAPSFPVAANTGPVRPTLVVEPGNNYDASQFSTHVEYLLWFYKQSHVPLLFGSIPPNLANMADLPPNSISPIFGGARNGIDYGGQSGARFGVGGWFDKDQDLGLDVDYFQLEQGKRNASAQSNPNGLPVLGPTFYDPITQKETIITFSEPGTRTATLNLSSNSRFWGAEANFRRELPAVFADHLEVLAGFRHVQFDENLNIGGTTIAADPAATSLSYVDSFSVRDHFDGPQIGLASDYTYNRLFLNLKGKFAVGEMSETVRINGATNILAPMPSQSKGGILAEPSNIGRYGRTVFTFLPEITINTGVQVNDHIRAFVGYNLIYLDRLERAGSAIDAVDTTQVRALNFQPNMNATRPAFQYQDGRFWSSGLNAGLEFSF